MSKAVFLDAYYDHVKQIEKCLVPKLSRPLPPMSQPYDSEGNPVEHAVLALEEDGRAVMLVAYGDKRFLTTLEQVDKTYPSMTVKPAQLIATVKAHQSRQESYRTWSIEQYVNIVRYLTCAGYRFKTLGGVFEYVPNILAYKDNDPVQAFLITEIDAAQAASHLMHVKTRPTYPEKKPTLH